MAKVNKSLFAQYRKAHKDVMLHLGAGDVHLKNFLNIDIRPIKGIDLVADICHLDFIPDDCIKRIYACHVLEHISHQENISVLREWYRILQPGGELIISVPDFNKLIHVYNKTGHTVWNIKSPLMGEQDYPEDTHYSVYNKAYLDQILKFVGFVSVRELKEKEAISKQDWSFREMSVPDGRKFFISLNIVAVK